MTVARFALFNNPHGETVCMVEMDDDLLRPEAGIMHAESMTLRPLKGGGNYTLVPVEDDYKVATLKRVHEIHTRVTSTGCKLHTQWSHRMDEVLMALEMLFTPVEFYLVENAQDMQWLIKSPSHNDEPDWEAKKVTHSVLGELFDDAIAEEKAVLALAIESDKADEKEES